MQSDTLLIITQVAGIFLLMSTVVLLFFRRIYLDATTKEPIKFTLPVVGEISTQAPVIVLILIAAFMVVYPISRSGPDHATLHGHIEPGGKHVSAIVVAMPDYQFGQEADSDFTLNIPLLATQATYRVMFIIDKLVIDDQTALLNKDGQIDLKPVRWSPPSISPEESAIPTRKDVSDAALKALSITN